MTKIIAIANQKGGVGKTTTAINLAAFLQQSGRPTLLLDLDPQANATSGLGASIPDEAPLAKLLQNPSHWEQLSMPVCDTPLRLVPARQKLDKLCADLLTRENITRLREELLASPALEYVIIDCPPASGRLAHFGMELSDSVLIPVQSEYYALEGLGQMMPVIDEINACGHELKIEGILVTMFSYEVAAAREVLALVRSRFPDLTFDTVIPRDPLLTECPRQQCPAWAHDPRSRGAWAYLNFTKEVIRHEQETRKRARRVDPASSDTVAAGANPTKAPD